MFAVIKTGGKQYLVQEGDVLKVEKLDAAKGDTVEMELLLTADGDKLDIGMPLLARKVQAEILDEGRAKKVELFTIRQRAATQNVPVTANLSPQSKLQKFPNKKRSLKRLLFFCMLFVMILADSLPHLQVSWNLRIRVLRPLAGREQGA